MTELLRVTVPGRPVPKARPRVSQGGTYTPAATAAFEATVGWRARALWRGRPTSDELDVEVLLHVRPGPARGDVDNYAKAVLDGLQGVVMVDDRQVRRLTVELLDAPGRQHEHTLVVVRLYAPPVSTTPAAPGGSP